VDAAHPLSGGCIDEVPIVVTGFRALIAVAQGFEACGTDHCGYVPQQLAPSDWSRIETCTTQALRNRDVRHQISSLYSFSVSPDERRSVLEELLCAETGTAPTPRSVNIGLSCIALGYWVCDTLRHHPVCGSSPPPHHKRGIQLETRVPLRESVLWKQQLQFYARKDNAAWKPGAVVWLLV
jgi:hypothetical protein